MTLGDLPSMLPKGLLLVSQVALLVATSKVQRMADAELRACASFAKD
jgi:hypothetical protein